MVTAQIDAVKELQASFTILQKNWLLALPTAIAALLGVILVVIILAAAVGGVVAGGMMGGQNQMAAAGALLGGAGLIALLGGIVVILVSLIAHATVMFGAMDAWAGRPVDLGTAMSRAFGKLPQLMVSGLLILLMAIIPAALSFIGIGLLLLIALGFFMMYVVPSITAGNHSATEAIGDSFNTAKSNFGPSAIAFLGILVIVVVGNIVSAIFSHVLGLNLVIGFVVGGLVYAYAAIVAVRFYELLHRVAPAANLPTTAT